MVGGQAQTSSTIGRHSELIAQTALLANGWSVLEPIVAEPYDIAVMRRGDKTARLIQIKTILKRHKQGRDWFVIRGKKSNGEVYTHDDCDYFIGVYDNRVYMTPCREISEYWVAADEVETKWTRLMTTIETIDEVKPTI